MGLIPDSFSFSALRFAPLLSFVFCSKFEAGWLDVRYYLLSCALFVVRCEADSRCQKCPATELDYWLKARSRRDSRRDLVVTKITFLAIFSFFVYTTDLSTDL